MMYNKRKRLILVSFVISDFITSLLTFCVLLNANHPVYIRTMAGICSVMELVYAVIVSMEFVKMR